MYCIVVINSTTNLIMQLMHTYVTT